ncbi:putative Zn-dependent peptidase [Arcicella aurantiaca]|uniref:Putative Zn-dependent peptidase n=1 Tax=Arcicella aurantiaca TaxID=591202 RepID=A0A316EF92_9BACT|nr:pitrilysin family protein [Arcicella aurantiaca]PWK27374.1 putative Zn-dependent peptidase [Arcicella aurantiaca]
MLDRTISPDFQTIQNINIPPVQVITLSNGISLYVINVGEQPVIKVEFSFDAGNLQESQNGVSLFTAKMITEGTTKYNSAEISEYFDKFGSFTESGQGLDRASFTVYGLKKHLSSLLPMVQELLNDAVFPEGELETLKKIQQQTLQVNSGKTAFIANKTFRKKIFGDSHPYGNSISEEAIQAVNQDLLINFYSDFWKGKPFKIFLSGNVGEAEIALIEQYFGKTDLGKSPLKKEYSLAMFNKGENVLVEKEGAVQSSIRMGKQFMTRKHPDFFTMLLLNETLGGYFGSRLMKNIREDKGFTYGISSNLALFGQAGYFVIGTDVKKEFTQQTIDEIHKEIKILQTELISSNELETVKNYMIGSFAGSLNTPFDIADRYKVIFSENLSLDFYQNYISNIQQISDVMLLEAANKYLDIDSLFEIVVGGK